MEKAHMKFETQVFPADFNDDRATNAVAVPIYQTTLDSFRDSQHGADLFDLAETGNIYSGIMDPTCDVLKQQVSAAESGAAALCMASGMTVITATVNRLCIAGGSIVSANQLYGGTYS
jgi:O-acetylhomoserine (thiol)-lyase